MSAAPRPARWLLLRLISAGVLVLGIMTALGSLPWRGARFPGFLVMPNRVVPSAGLPSWSGVSDGQPPYQEVLLAVDDTPVTSAADAYRRAAAHRVGEPARYTFARDGVLETHTYPLRQLTDAEYFAIFGAYFIAGLAHLLLAWCAAEPTRMRTASPTTLRGVLEASGSSSSLGSWRFRCRTRPPRSARRASAVCSWVFSSG